MNNIEFISAGAGSGKTYKLTSTLAEALESGEARPHAVLATTFTVKAATELRERARSWLLNKGKIELATAIGQAKLGTVNSVCGQLLKRFCFEIGLSPDQTVLSEGQGRRLLATSLAETLDESGREKLVALTIKFGIEHAEWSAQIEDVVNAARNNDIPAEEVRAMGRRNADLMLENWSTPSTGDDPTSVLSGALTKALSDVSLHIAAIEAAGGNVAQNLRNGHRDLERLERCFREGRWCWPDWIAACSLNAGAAVRAAITPVSEAAQAHESHPEFHDDVRAYLDLVFDLAGGTLETYAETKRMMGAVDFSDQEVLLLEVIRKNEDVRKALADELDLVMVDEFQDTSPLQLALFVELAKLAKHSVWVGDPKQAIYGFRGTDARLIAGILAAVESWGGKLGEPLTTSRRSTPSLVSLTNAVFNSAFLPQLQPSQVCLQPSRGDIAGQPALFHWNFESRNNESDYLALGQAVSELLKSELRVVDRQTQEERPVRPGDIAVLCRKNDQVELAVTSLTQWGVPSASPRAGLLGTPEAIFVLACLRRLLDAGDSVATALILTLADSVPAQKWLGDRLEYIAGEGASPSLWKAEGDDAHPLLVRLETLRPTLAALTPREALRLAKSESHVARVASQWSSSPHQARTRIANVEALMDLGAAYEDECIAARRPATVSGLLRWLDSLADSQADDRSATADDAVSVMTHHGAKGLEWPVVILTSLGTATRSALWGVRARTDGEFNPERPLENRFVHFWPKTWAKRTQPQSAANAEGSAIGQMMEADALAESKRLLYVSMTRARDANVLVTCQRSRGVNRAWVDEVRAGDLLFGATEPVVLPDERTIFREARTWTAADIGLAPPAQDESTCSWYVAAPAKDAPPLWYRPSDAEGGMYAVAESEPIGVRVAITASIEMEMLGSALHLCIARVGVAGRGDVADVERILGAWGVAHAVDSAAVVAQVQAFFSWLERRWPGGSVRVEMPLEANRTDGTRLRGRVDLLVDTPDGWVLIDHKSNPGGTSRDDASVQKYGSQLSAYAEAVEKCTGKQVKEQWLYLPVAGRVVRLTAETVAR
ncbi:UvrD-helicase domain-containing protein [Paraburkholderia bryophila]|uniref:DNA 3'-5' helicase n=1 Tax=Paraburkholderia bryophila TaxID=420952 RepID=A0A329CAA8_9BURK|nr:UvrD-helicase domain-containing protein [Paraburkholderia bryophila]RAS31906.1 ATP-dependent exoDNAse (exonuclease V) beta subunit [Paraburkholderia bryophila]